MWAYCSGSLIPNIQMPDTSGYEAAEGTVAHEIGEQWLRDGKAPYHRLGEVVVMTVGEGDQERTYSITIDEEMFSYVEEYVDWCMYLEGDHYVETRVDFSDLTPIPNQGGTADHAACRPRRLTITDLKYGIGVEVYAKDNTQAILYAYGFFREWDWFYDFQEIEIRICQPRRAHFDVWVITREELLEWAHWLSERAHEAWIYGAPRTPGPKQCQWCRIKPSCKAFAAWFESLSEGCFEDLDKPITMQQMDDTMERLERPEAYTLSPHKLKELTLEHKVKIYDQYSLVDKWFKAIGEELYNLLNSGQDVPGKKLVKGRSARVYTSEEKAVEHFDFLGLSDDAIRPRILKSPAQMELELIKHKYKRKNLEGLLDTVVRRIDGSPIMVDANDKRPALIKGDHDVFDDLDSEDDL
jgi:hypothetical protein